MTQQAKSGQLSILLNAGENQVVDDKGKVLAACSTTLPRKEQILYWRSIWGDVFRAWKKWPR